MKNSSELILGLIKKDVEKKNSFRPINTMQEIFSIKPASNFLKEEFFSKLEGYLEGDEERNFLRNDLEQIVNLSNECCSIQKQGVILLGEKIAVAKKIFSSYQKCKPLFSFWIKQTFSSEKTAYNALSFYEFYQDIQEESIREKLKKMPLKASYALASRKGAIEDKIAIINSNYHSKSEAILLEIQEKIPLEKEDARKIKVVSLDYLKKIIFILKKIEIADFQLNLEEKKLIHQIKCQLDVLENKA